MSDSKISDRPYSTFPKYVAHRGDLSVSGVRENTLEAFELALKQPIQMIETDLRLSKDQEWVLSHDRTLTRVWQRECWVSDLTLKELRDLGLASLTDALDLIDGRVELYLDLKDFPSFKNLEKLVQILQSYTENENSKWLMKNFSLASFNFSIIKDLLEIRKNLKSTLKSANKNFQSKKFKNEKFKIQNETLKNDKIQSSNKKFQIGYITGNLISMINENLVNEVDFLSISADVASPGDVQTLRGKNQIDLYIYTLNDLISLRHFYQYRPTGLLSDFPALFSRL